MSASVYAAPGMTYTMPAATVPPGMVMEPVAVPQQVATEPVQTYEAPAPQVIERTIVVAPPVYVEPAPPRAVEPVQTYEAPQVIERTIVVAPPVYVEPAPPSRAVEPTYAAQPVVVEQLPPVTAPPVYMTSAPVATHAAPPAGMQFVTEPVATMQAPMQARAAGPWSESLTFRLCDDSQIQQYRGRATVHEKAQFQSVTQAVASLNGLPGGGQDTWAVVYSQSHGAWYVLYKAGANGAALEHFGLQSS